MNRDPIGYAGSEWCLYELVSSQVTFRSDPFGLWGWDGDWIELGLGGLLGFQGEEVQAAAGQSIIDNPVRDVLGGLTVVDPTPLSGSVQTVIDGAIEGDRIGEIGKDLVVGALPGPDIVKLANLKKNSESLSKVQIERSARSRSGKQDRRSLSRPCGRRKRAAQRRVGEAGDRRGYFASKCSDSGEVRWR